MAKLKQAGGDIWYYIDRGGKIKRNWQRLNKKEIDTSGKKINWHSLNKKEIFAGWTKKIEPGWTKKKLTQIGNITIFKKLNNLTKVRKLFLGDL